MNVNRHWQHFIALEQDFAATTRFVELCEENFNSYSIEYAKLLLSVCAEVDVLCKFLCNKIAGLGKFKDINEYKKCIAEHCPDFSQEEVLVRRYNLTLKPWENWADGRSPKWWSAYNHIKHDVQNTHFNQANLENCISSLSGLFVLLIYCFHAAEIDTAKLEVLPVLLGREVEKQVLYCGRGYGNVSINKPITEIATN